MDDVTTFEGMVADMVSRGVAPETADVVARHSFFGSDYRTERRATPDE